MKVGIQANERLKRGGESIAGAFAGEGNRLTSIPGKVPCMRHAKPAVGATVDAESDENYAGDSDNHGCAFAALFIPANRTR